tara:strand:+ start:7509 stop:8588 length:1080 start_codon:yes stop_codon:yes gene_type:complete
MNKMDIDKIINKLRNNYDTNNNHYEFLFSVLYFTDENFKEVNFLHSYSSNRQKKKFLNKQPLIVEEYKSNNKINHNINHNINVSVFKSIFENDFIKSKPSKFLDVFISCCGNKSIVNVSSNVKSILLKKLLTDFDTCELYKKYKYRKRSGFTKKILRSFFEDGNEIEDNPLFISFLCDYFKMNICVVIPDKEKNDIIFYSSYNNFSIYKSTIIVEKCDGDMYQYYIMSNGESIFTSNTSFIYRLLLYKIQKDFITKLNNIANNSSINRKIFHKVIEKNKVITEKIKDKSSENKDKLSENKDKLSEYNSKDLLKKKLLILQNISEEFGINTKKSKKNGKGFKNKTKSELVLDIMNHLSKK